MQMSTCQLFNLSLSAHICPQNANADARGGDRGGLCVGILRSKIPPWGMGEEKVKLDTLVGALAARLVVVVVVVSCCSA